MENKKYDLEKAKEDCRRHEDALEEAQSCMCGHCHECGFDPLEMKAALDEVERLRSFRGRIARILGQSPSDCDDLLIVGLDSRIILAKRLTAKIKELEAEVEAKNKQIKELQDIIDKPPEADWVADYHLLQSALDGPIIDAARKWHAAYRKAQNSNLMRAKEVERLRAAVGVWEKANSDLIAGLKAGAKEVIAKDARIKELEADRIAYRNLGSRIEDLKTYIERLEAAFLEQFAQGIQAPKEKAELMAREALERIKEGGKDE